MKREGNHPTRDRILQAAVDLMWRHGYPGTSPAQIMQATGVGQGSFYHHFPDKRSLGLAVVDEIVRANTEAMDGIFRPEVPPMERIRHWIEGISHQYRPPCDRGCPLGKLGIEMSAEDPAFRERLTAGFARIRERIVRALREADAAGEIDPEKDPDGLAEVILAIVEGAILIAQCEGEAGPMDRSVLQLERLLDGLQRPGLVPRANAADP